MRCRGKSASLQRALSDFGAEKSFAQASQQLQEHYGVPLHRSSVREVVLRQAERGLAFVEGQEREALEEYEHEGRKDAGEPWLIVESGGSMVRTGELVRTGADGSGGGEGQRKLRRRTRWREVRLSVVEALSTGERQYGATLGSPQRAGAQMFALALQSGYGENTQVHGVGDGAPWIAQQMAQVFPRQNYLLDRYHLLQHLYQGASQLVEQDRSGSPIDREAWVSQQIRRIDQGRTMEVVAQCRNPLGRNPLGRNPLGRNPLGDGGEYPLEQLANYLESRLEQLDYAGARKEGLPLGSGAVEGGHRHVIQARLKLPGAWWKETTLNPMLALRTLRSNGHWLAFWS